MKKNLAPGILIAAAMLLVALPSSSAETAAAARAKVKNWRAPAERIVAQEMVDALMAGRSDLASVTLHGVPPGTTVHTMFAGSWPDRIGNADDPDDVDIAVKALTVLDPALSRKAIFEVMLPLKEASGGVIGALVVVFKRADPARDELYYYTQALGIRGDLQAKTPDLESLFKPAS